MRRTRFRKRFAFFSQETHDANKGSGTLTFRNAASGVVVKANYDGYAIGGYPGFRRDGKVVRPPRHKTYVLIGEVAPGKLELCPQQSINRRHPWPLSEFSL